MATQELTLKTTVGGQFDWAALKEAITALHPLEPEREYVLRLELAPVAPPAPAEPAGGGDA
jgi:hypothetical protein